MGSSIYLSASSVFSTFTSVENPIGVPFVTALTGTTYPLASQTQLTTLVVGDQATTQAWEAEDEMSYWFGYSPILSISTVDLDAPGEWRSYGNGTLTGRPGTDIIRMIEFFTNYAASESTGVTGLQSYVGTYTGDVFGFFVNNRNAGYFDDAVDTFILPEWSLRVNGPHITVGNGTAYRTNTTTAHTATFQAYDVNGATYRTFGTLLNGDVPRFTVSQPAGGVLAIIPPTSDPGIPGAIWNNAGTLAISV